MKIWIAAVAAVAVQPLVLALRMAPDIIRSSQPLYGFGFVMLAVVVVAAAAVLLFGIPTFFILRRFRRDGWFSLGFAGFLIGALPVTFSWPSHEAGFSSGQNWHGTYVDTYVNGIPTKFAWLSYVENVAFYGLHGLIGALVFYAVICRFRREP